jgi:hypothetical protein
MLCLDDVDRITGGRLGVYDVACPQCGPAKSARGARREVLRVWRLEDGFASFYCARCGEGGYAHDRHGPSPDPTKLARARAEREERDRATKARRLQLARWLWQCRKPLRSSIAEVCLRDARGYTGPLPATLGFLAPRGDHAPALIAAFGLASEALHIADDAVVGVHIIKITPDGSDRRRDIENAKITLGLGFVAPIVLAPPNDLLGLTIAEGIEDALTDHDLTGRGAWAAASAGRMPGLADLVPSYVESVTILVDDNDAGRTDSNELAAALADRGIEVLMAGWS